MAIDNGLLKAAFVQISGVAGISMAPELLVEDVALLAKVWPDEASFAQAVASSVRALELAVSGRITPDALRDDLTGWFSYHYQLKRAQGIPADLRLVYRPVKGGIEVKGFGHRFRPADIYRRMMSDARR